jgi:Tfp pilus assembly protein PilN
VHVNLLATSYRDRLMIRTVASRGIRIWIGCAIIVAVPCWQEYRRGARLDEVASQLEERATPYRLARQQAGMLSDRLARVAQREQLLGQLDEGRDDVLLLWAISRSVAALERDVQVLSVHLEPPVGQPRGAKRLFLSGIAEGDSTVADFVGALRESGLFAQVDLKSMSGHRSQNSQLVEYQLECRL